jgi:hypothetical protein
MVLDTHVVASLVVTTGLGITPLHRAMKRDADASR